MKTAVSILDDLFPQILTVDRSLLAERVGRLTAGDLQLVLAGIDLVLGRE